MQRNEPNSRPRPCSETNPIPKPATLLYRYPLLTGHASRFPRHRSLHKLANSLGIKGWVRNLDDGSVSVYAIGSRTQHDELSGHRGMELLAACGKSGRSSNSGTGDEFPHREGTENNTPAAAETSCLSPNWASRYFYHRLPEAALEKHSGFRITG
jgi:acylphosphatase